MQSTRTQGLNFREAHTMNIWDEKEHSSQMRDCQEETGEKRNWHRNNTESVGCAQILEK